MSKNGTNNSNKVVRNFYAALADERQRSGGGVHKNSSERRQKNFDWRDELYDTDPDYNYEH